MGTNETRDARDKAWKDYHDPYDRDEDEASFIGGWTAHASLPTVTVEQIAEVLVDHTRLTDDGQCYCGEKVALGLSFAKHQADVVLALFSNGDK